MVKAFPDEEIEENIMGDDNKKIGVSQKAIIFRPDGKFLTIRRSQTAPYRPLNWDLPGGDIDYGEDAREGMIREIKEETNLEVNNLKVIDTIAAMNNKDEFWVTVCYSAQPTTSAVKLSFEHDDSRWMTPEEFQQLGASPRIKKFVERFYSQRSPG
jgi:8-oxo-dGTP diphosphatase